MTERVNLTGVPGPFPGCVLTVGTFDGVHLGHRHLLERVRQRAVELSRPSLVVTFWPHPRSVIQATGVDLLCDREERSALLRESGLSQIIELSFDMELARMQAADFVQQVLLEHLGMQHLVMGYDHAFGRGRDGTPVHMRALAEQHGFTVEFLDALQVEGDPVSSTRIRRELGDAKLRQVERLLGRPYTFAGEVIHGDARGRRIGFPTANLRLEAHKVLPREGVYAVRIHLQEEVFDGMMNLGARPTFDDPRPQPEIHLFDFSGDLYGRELRIELVEFVRDTIKFESIDHLRNQLQMDEATVRALLASRCRLQAEPERNQGDRHDDR